MESKAPALLVVVVDTDNLAWFVAGIGLDGTLFPLLRSEADDLSPYVGLDTDEQLIFLRHRLCGVLQRGCDRLFPLGMKACQFVFLFQGRLPDTAADLTERVADHFVQWMLNPPVVVYTTPRHHGSNGTSLLEKLAGDIDAPYLDVLRAARRKLLVATADNARWEVSRRKVVC